jgi:hypothetical protein
MADEVSFQLRNVHYREYNNPGRADESWSTLQFSTDGGDTWEDVPTIFAEDIGE